MSGLKTRDQVHELRDSLSNAYNDANSLRQNLEHQNRVLINNSRRQVFSTHQNRDLVTLHDREVNTVLAHGTGRPPRANL